MADKKISALTSLAQGDVAASTDVLPIVDTSATETKKITASALVGAGMTAGVTNVDINSGSIDGTTIGANSAAAGTFTNLTASGTVSFSGATVSNGGAVTTIDINGGTIDATSIGASSASTGAFTTLSASSTVSGTGFSTYLASPPAIGGTTAAAGSFTTLTTSSTVTLNGGTANGVLYLNGSKVATSGSALVFDGTNLSATRGLKAASAGIAVSSFVDGLNVGGYDSIGFLASPGNALAIGGYRAAQWSGLEFYASGALQATLNSTGLGIGTASPADTNSFGRALDIRSSTGAAAYFRDSDDATKYSVAGFFGADSNAYYGSWGTGTGVLFYSAGSERARITSGGGLLVGTTSTGGNASNITRVTGGIFSTFNATPSIANNTATTVATLPSGEGMYLVSASLLNSGDAASYNELALVRVSQSNTAVSTIVGASSLDITVSGLNVQVTHGQGSTQTIPVSIIRLL